MPSRESYVFLIGSIYILYRLFTGPFGTIPTPPTRSINTLNDSIQHLSKATALIAQAAGAARCASLGLRNRKQSRQHLYKALEELRKAKASLPAPRYLRA